MSNHPNFNINHFPNSGWNKPIIQQKQPYHPPPPPPPSNNPNKPKAPVNQNPRVLKLQSDIQKCSVYESAVELLKNYHNLESSVFSYKQGQVLVSVIQLQGFIEVNNSIIFLNAMLPQKFPEHPPNFRIINKQPQYLEIVKTYIPFISVNDPNSIVLKSVKSIKEWNTESKILPIMRDIETIVKKQLPFKEKVRQRVEPTNKFQPAKEVSREKRKITIKQVEVVKPLKVNSKAQETIRLQLADIETRGVNFVQKTKQLTDKLLQQHQSTFTAIHNSEISKACLQNEIEQIKRQNKQSDKYFLASDMIGGINIGNMIVPVNDWSRQLLELVCIEKAGQDMLDRLAILYDQRSISFEQLLKLVRKTEEERFLCKAMIKKKLVNKQ